MRNRYLGKESEGGQDDNVKNRLKREIIIRLRRNRYVEKYSMQIFKML